MKKIAIIYNQSLKQIQGINFVNNSFVVGRKYFIENGLVLDKIYSPYEIFDCDGKLCLNLIGSNVNSQSYIRERKFRVFLRNLFSSDKLLGAAIKIYFNGYLNAKRATKKYIKSREQNDFIIFQDFFSAYYYSKIKTKPKVKTALILHCSNEPLEQMRPLFKGLFNNKYFCKVVDGHVAKAVESVDKVIYLSELAYQNSIIKDRKKTYIHNGVEDYQIANIAETREVVNLVTVGSAIKHKGQHLVIESLRLLDPKLLKILHYHIIGSGSELEIYKEMVRDYKLEDVVTFYGSRNDVPELLKRMDVFILPSLSEGMPMSIIEAMRQGLFIIATKVGGIGEMLQPQFSLFIERNAESIARAISDVLNKDLVSVTAKQASRQNYLNSFTLRKMIDSYSRVLQSL